jgi:hypothetical protein
MTDAAFIEACEAELAAEIRAWRIGWSAPAEEEEPGGAGEEVAS